MLLNGLLLQSRISVYTRRRVASIARAGTATTRRYSHKKAAVLAGWGRGEKRTVSAPRARSAVRLGPYFTDCPLGDCARGAAFVCRSARSVRTPAPSGAIKGSAWRPGHDRGELLYAEACNSHMRAHFMQIGAAR
jgi:hypothetical protein